MGEFARFGFNDLLYLVRGAYTTIQLCGIAFLFGGLLGIIVGIARSNHKITAFRWIAGVYIEIFRGVPLLLQLIIGYFAPSVLGWDISVFLAVSIVLCLYTGAYLGEIFRSGLESIHKEQWEAASSLGMKYFQSLRYVIIPQGVRVIIPSIIGFLVALVKAICLVSILNVVDLTLAAQRVAVRAYVPLLAMGSAALIYFVICYPLSKIGQRLEAQSKRSEA
ncbi:amino acid ABC transporter permease [Candidatus Aerophobetes bacterium]|nr:amino acid ABC transporter permease [Candidatus Aerophobetes bacterium]